MKIIVANDYTTPGGRKHNAGTTVEVPNALGRSLINRGKAREALFHGEPVGRKPKERKRSAPAERKNSAAAETETPAGEEMKGLSRGQRL